jgi:putative transposase
MRSGRLLGRKGGYYHCITRCIERRFILQDEEKEYLRKLMRRLEEFSGIQVLTYVLMSNHIHMLLDVPERLAVEEKELLRRCRVLYGKKGFKEFTEKWRLWTEQGQEKRVAEDYQRLEARMYDLGVFMKELKQRFSQWYNGRNQRTGTLWEERFKSILIEGRENALLTMAAYIDLNPVRARICNDPKDYRFSGYGEAMGGGAKAKSGLMRLMVEATSPGWLDVAARYRVHVFGVGEQKGYGPDGRPMKAGVTPAAARSVAVQGGQLSQGALLRCRVRYLSDGAVLGSKEFVEAQYRANRKKFGLRRKTGARKMKHGDWQGLHTMRDLRRDVVTSPDTASAK